MKQKIIFVLGTRPEAIKLAPLILEMRSSKKLAPFVCATGQHKDLLQSALKAFGVTPDVNLRLMKRNQTLASLSAKALVGLDEVFKQEAPSAVVVQGDTTSAFIGALCAYYNKIRVFHVEAGLRTGNMFSPFPEEANRVLIDRISNFYFAPTRSNRDQLKSEGVKSDRVVVTGNTGIDALLIMKKIVSLWSEKDVVKNFKGPGEKIFASRKKLVLITIHRRESFGSKVGGILNAIRQAAIKNKDWLFVFPMHPNPNIRAPAKTKLRKISNLILLEHQHYSGFVWLLSNACLIVTDSGGIQEEAPSLQKPILVVRERTERMEGVRTGQVKLVGTKADKILEAICQLLEKPDHLRSWPKGKNPYGNGKASEKICKAIARVL